MDIEKKAFIGGSWLVLFKGLSQLFTWVGTIIVARILVPADYGLLGMATIVTGYAMLNSELGLGAAIIQKDKVSQNELSSIFWFALIFNIFLAVIVFFLSYPVAVYFNEPKIILMIQILSFVFIINSMHIIPINLLKKELEFKKIGKIDVITALLSSVAIIILAIIGLGIWALIIGQIARAFLRVFLLFLFLKWIPSRHFNLYEVKSLIKFGITVAMTRTVFYLSEKIDIFFAGRVWTAATLGYYTFGLSLAQIPTEKITVLINQVSYSAFSKLQNEKKKFNEFYLNTMKIISIIVIPLFVGGYLIGDELILIVLGEKWASMIFVFKILCLTQIVTSLNAINSYVHLAQNRPKWSLYFHAVLVVFMSVSFYFAVQYGLNAILIPWVTTYNFLCFLWILITLRKIDISFFSYLKKISQPIIGTSIMFIGASVFRFLAYEFLLTNPFFILSGKIFTGSLIYILFIYIFDRSIFPKVIGLLRN